MHILLQVNFSGDFQISRICPDIADSRIQYDATIIPNAVIFQGWCALYISSFPLHRAQGILSSRHSSKVDGY